MRFISYLNEKRSKDVVSVDIQPMYKNYINFNLSEYFDWLSNQREILYFFNGPDTVGEDTKQDILSWMIYDYDFPEEKINDIIFFDKGYAFFRGWMDQGVDETTLKKALRHMINNKVNDSREIDPEEWEEIIGNQDIYYDDMIHLPDIPLNILKKFSGSYLTGGGRNECLKEVKILMDVLNIRYTMVRDFIF